MALRIVKYNPELHGAFENYNEPANTKNHRGKQPIRLLPDLNKPNQSLRDAFTVALAGPNEQRGTLIHEHLRYGWRMAADGLRAHLLKEGYASDTCQICTSDETCPDYGFMVSDITAPDSKFSTIVTVSALPLILACNRARAFAVNSADTLRISVNSTLKFAAQDSEGDVEGEIADGDSEQISVKFGPKDYQWRWDVIRYHYQHEGEDMTFAVNAVYLAEAINFLIAPDPDTPKKHQKRAENVRIRIFSPTSPIVITCLEHVGRGAVVMPMFIGH